MVFEAIMESLGYPLSRACRDLERAAAMSAAERRAWLEDRKWAIARHHLERNPVYRRLLNGRLPPSWGALPLVTKSLFQQSLRAMLSEGFSPTSVHTTSTSGSSGEPFLLARDKYAHARSWALIRQRYALHGLTPASRQARFYGIPLERVPRLKETVKDWAMNRVRFPVFDLSDAVLERLVSHLSEDHVDYIYGYANALIAFATYLLRNGRSLKHVCPSLTLCITTSEMCTPEDRVTLAGGFGVPVINEYGASEFGIIAFENKRREWIVSDENLYAEIVDDDGQPVADGAIGHVLVTDLYNEAMPFIRYRIGDLARLDDGRGAERQRLLSLEGRQNDMILLPSGRRAAGLTVYYIARSLLDKTCALQEFVVRQTSLDEFVFDVVAKRRIGDAETRAIQASMERYLEPGLKVRINQVGVIRRPASGKRKQFYSELGGLN